jgi:nucleoside-diphosphate-sugar epimerase
VFSPHQRRTFMHVRDCVDAYVRIMQDIDDYLGHVWTIGDPGLTTSKGELAAEIADAADATVIIEGTPDPDARDLDVALNGEGTYSLMLPHSTWAQHIPELVQFYGWHPGE